MSRIIKHGAVVLIGYTIFFTLFFSPVLFSDRVFASGDALEAYASLYYLPRYIWSDLMMLGFPNFADPLSQTWYPVSRLFNLLHFDFNWFELSAYVLTSCFSYGYLLAITRSRLAATAGSLMVGISGFFVGNSMHTLLIHSAMWLPLMLWSSYELVRRPSKLWFAVSCLSVGSSILAGFIQATSYSLGLAAAHAVVLVLFPPENDWWGSATTRRSVWLRLTVAVSPFLLGCGIAGIQAAPSFELCTTIWRWIQPYEFTITGSFPPFQLLQFLFPYIFGGRHQSPYGLDYFGMTPIQAYYGYLGILPLLLAVIGAVARRQSILVRFWLVVAVFGFLAALGGSTPLSRLLYLVPFYGKFRLPTRHFIELTLATAALAAIGIQSIETGLASKRLVRRTVFGAACVLLVSIYPAVYIAELLLRHMAPVASLAPAVVVPLLVFVVGACAVTYFSGHHSSRWSRAFLVAAIIIDLGSFSWYCPWHYDAPSQSALVGPPHAIKYKTLTQNSKQRLCSARGNCGAADELPSNLNQLWGILSAAAYQPLMPMRFKDFLNISEGGFLLGDWSSPADTTLDLASVRYLVLPTDDDRYRIKDEANQTRFARLEQDGTAVVYENRRALPRAWLVNRVVLMPGEEILKTVHSGRLLDGTKFDPAHTALVEERCPLTVSQIDPSSRVTMTRLANETREYEYTCRTAAFLLMSDMYYPGWQAFVDGKEQHLYRADYALDGLLVPPGRHSVRLLFTPISLYWGVAITLCSLLAMLAIVFVLPSSRTDETVAEDSDEVEGQPRSTKE